MVALLKQCDKIAQTGPESGPFSPSEGDRTGQQPVSKPSAMARRCFRSRTRRGCLRTATTDVADRQFATAGLAVRTPNERPQTVS